MLYNHHFIFHSAIFEDRAFSQKKAEFRLLLFFAQIVALHFFMN